MQMQLEEEKVLENSKLSRLENQKFTRLRRRQRRPGVRGSKTCQPSYLPTFLIFAFLLSYFSKYLCLSVICPYPLSYFLFPISGLKVLIIEFWGLGPARSCLAMAGGFI